MLCSAGLVCGDQVSGWLERHWALAPWLQAAGSVLAIALAVHIARRDSRARNDKERLSLDAHRDAAAALCIECLTRIETAASLLGRGGSDAETFAADARGALEVLNRTLADFPLAPLAKAELILCVHEIMTLSAAAARLLEHLDQEVGKPRFAEVCPRAVTEMNRLAQVVRARIEAFYALRGRVLADHDLRGGARPALRRRQGQPVEAANANAPRRQSRSRSLRWN